MSQLNKRTQLSDDDEISSSKKMVTQPKLHIPKKRKMQSYSQPIPVVARLPEKQDAIIILSSDEEEKEDEKEDAGNKDFMDRKGKGKLKEDVVDNSSIQSSTSQPKSVDTKMPMIKPALITLDDSDDEAGDAMAIDHETETNNAEQDTNDQLEVEKDELASDSNDEDDTYLDRVNLISKNSIHLIDKNTQGENTRNTADRSPSPASKLSPPFPPQYEEPNPIPEPADLQDKSRSILPQHQESEQHSEEEPEEHSEQQSEAGSVVEAQLEAQDRSSIMSEPEIPAAEHEFPETEEYEAPESPSTSNGDELRDVSNNQLFVVPHASSPELSDTSLSQNQDTYRLKKVVISKPSNKSLKKNRLNDASFTHNENIPSTSNANEPDEAEDTDMTNEQPQSTLPNDITDSVEQDEDTTRENGALSPTVTDINSNYNGGVTISDDDDDDDENASSLSSEAETPPENNAANNPPSTEAESVNDDDTSTVENMSVDENENTYEAEIMPSNKIGTHDSNEPNENLLSTDSEHNTAEEDLSDGNIPVHPPGRRTSIIPVNSVAHIDTNAVSRDQSQRIIQRRLQKTGYTYDSAMFYHARLDPTDIHPEDPRRIFKVFNIFRERGLLSECRRILSRRATKEEVLLVHNIVLYRAMRDTREHQTRLEYQIAESNYDSIYLNSNSFNSGLFAVGCLIELVEAVVLNQIKNGFAIIRPPGHHAESDRPGGFCMFNNVAIATKHCMRYLNVRKVLIVDWDIHFGNGTQQIFSDQADVLYMSLHRYEDGAFYPSDRKGSAEYTGHGDGRGKTVNIPWPCSGMTDADYLYAFRHVIIPIANEFNPDLVIVSAGFDAAINDPIGQCKVTPAGYGQMTHMLKSLARGKLVIALEGGYDLNSIAISALACMEVLLGESPDPIDPSLQPRPECLEVINNVKRLQSRYWSCCRV